MSQITFKEWFEQNKDDLPSFIDKATGNCNNDGTIPCNLGWACDGCPMNIKISRVKFTFVFR